MECLFKLFSLIFKFHCILLLKLCYWQIDLRINTYVLLSLPIHKYCLSSAYLTPRGFLVLALFSMEMQHSRLYWVYH